MMREYEIKLDVVCEGFDGVMQWFQPRVGMVPPDTAILTVTRADISGSDIFFALRSMRSFDGGKTWSDMVSHDDTLGRRVEDDGVETVIIDVTPLWHADSGRMLGTGQTARYLGKHLHPDPRRREVAYTAYNPADNSWMPWKMMKLPDMDGKFFSAGAGCGQRVDLPNGDILLPIYFMPYEQAKDSWHNSYSTAVARCRFDGETLTYIEHGNELTCPIPRGLYEPSLMQFNGKFYLTLRNDISGHVAVSDDGLNYSDPIPWCFDDGENLGSYNTQQHWVTHSDALYLTYTRRGAGNDHVFRHRAPLFMARVDTEKLCVIRDSEHIIMPEKGACFGNFGTVNVSPTETWVVDVEAMQGDANDLFNTAKTVARGANNRIYICRILWNKLNKIF